MFSSKAIFLLLFILTVTTRFFKLDWGNGLFFHPDENNMALAISRLSPSHLDPKFYAYGQFPLYLSFFSLKAIGLSSDFTHAVYSLRFWSAVWSCLSVFFAYKIGAFLFSKKSSALTFSLFCIFSPVLIQLAHFGTTESFLIFVSLFNFYSALKFHHRPSLSLLILSGIITGLGLGSKITTAFLTLPLVFSLLLHLRFHHNWFKFIFYSILYFYTSFAFFLISSPYSLISYSEFLSSMRYETSVATGSLPVFYTNQFLGTTPYLFQLAKIIPYAIGLPCLILAILGLFFLPKTKKGRQHWMIILFPCLIFFLYHGQLYTKWTRFIAPIYFIFPLLATLFISHYRRFYPFLLFLVLIPGISFLNLYLHSDIRLTASDWIDKNLPSRSLILSESGNVIDLPVKSGSFQITHLDFYQLDSDQEVFPRLVSALYQNNYIIVPSRRIFKNQTGSRFPLSQKYYQNLFSGQLGFQEIKKFEVFTDPFLNPENAEETWTVFDRPTIRIFRKIIQLSPEQITQLISPHAT